MGYANKVFFVTGGGRGIGRAIVERLVEEGARVCVIDVDREGGADVVREYGECVRFIPGDIAREPTVRSAIATCVKWAAFLTGQNLVLDGGMTRKMIYA